MMNLEGMEITEPALEELHAADKWILSKVNTLAKDATENMDKYELGIAVQKVYDFIWDSNSVAGTSKSQKFVLIKRTKIRHPQMQHFGH